MIDGSGHATALASAVALRRTSSGRLSLAGPAPFPPRGEAVDLASALRRGDPNRSAREALRLMARDTPGAVPVLLQGPPGPSLCAWAEGAGVDLLVVGAGAEGAPAADDVVDHLLANAPCPVLVVRAGRGAEGDRGGSGAMLGAARH